MTDRLYRAHYHRLREEYVTPFGTLDDATAYLYNGEDEGTMSACCVVDPDGMRRDYRFGEGLSDTAEPVGDHLNAVEESW